MRKIAKSCMLILLSVLVIQPLYAHPNERGVLCGQHACQYKVAYQKIYETMKEKMTNAPITGDATQDFLYEMIPHHEAAVEMSENVLKYGKNKEVRKIAQNIVKEQNKGITKMQKLLGSLKGQCSAKNDEEYIEAYEKILKTMLEKMSQQVESCDVDVMFLKDMIPHHEGAIAMAENILKYTTNPELKEIATQIVATQKSQLPKMEELLKTLNA